ncbi:MAG: 6-pyruvoyl-tetrahydropterin synthase-related protein [bacterium]|nr:6-pyruvoyl-tetrahydropterin synthase-related protein [bacterium]
MVFYQSLRDGQIIPQWADILCGGFGCPQFSFLYILPYYIISFFHFVGFSFLTSTKIFLIASYIGSGITMFVFMKDLTKNALAALTSAIFYLFAPYHLVDMHFRVSIGEVLAFVILPFFFYASKKTVTEKNYLWIFINALVLSFLILTHQVISTASIPFIVAYAVTLAVSPKKYTGALIRFFISLLVGLFLSCFYWLPILFEAKFVSYFYMKNVTFESFIGFFYAPWRYGFLFQGPTGHLSFLLGYAQIAVIVISVFLFVKKKVKASVKTFFQFFLVSFFILFFLIQSPMKPIVDHLPIVNNFQMVYRMLLILMFFVSALSGFLSLLIKKKYIYLLCAIAILSTILNWGNRRMIPEITDQHLRSDMIGSSNGHDLIVPKWVDTKYSWNIQKPNEPLQLLSGTAITEQISHTSNSREYLVKADTQVKIKENTFFFPGWKLYVNGNEEKFTYEDSQYSGVMVFFLPKGLYDIQFVYTDTPIRQAAKIISVFTFILMISFLFAKLAKNNRQNLPLHSLLKFSSRVFHGK